MPGRITKQRGKFLENGEASQLLAMHHPSAILRVPDADQRRRKRGELIDDLRAAEEELAANQR